MRHALTKNGKMGTSSLRKCSNVKLATANVAKPIKNEAEQERVMSRRMARITVRANSTV